MNAMDPYVFEEMMKTLSELRELSRTSLSKLREIQQQPPPPPLRVHAPPPQRSPSSPLDLSQSVQPRADLASGPSDPDLAQRVFVRNEDDALPDIILAVPETKPGVFTPCILAADPADFTEQFMTESAPEEPRIGCNSDDTDASTEHIVYTGSISFRIMPLLRSDTDVVALDNPDRGPFTEADASTCPASHPATKTGATTTACACSGVQSTPDSSSEYGVPFRLLTGHTHFVKDVVLSSDGQFTLSRFWDSEPHLWEFSIDVLNASSLDIIATPGYCSERMAANRCFVYQQQQEAPPPAMVHAQELVKLQLASAPAKCLLKCLGGSVDTVSALQLFNDISIKNSVVRNAQGSNLFLSTSSISEFLKEGDNASAVELFVEMRRDCLSGVVGFEALLTALYLASAVPTTVEVISSDNTIDTPSRRHPERWSTS
jgi:hypothetical protein